MIKVIKTAFFTVQWLERRLAGFQSAIMHFSKMYNQGVVALNRFSTFNLKDVDSEIEPKNFIQSGPQ